MNNREEIDKTGMRPKMGQTNIILPITFDYSGGRRDSQSSAKMWSVVLVVISLIIGIGLIFNKDRFILINLLLAVIIWVVVSLIIRFPLMKENKLREEEIKRKDSMGVMDYKSIWGIYNIDDEYPYICRFRTGKSGIFVLLNKDVILGKYSESEYEHYEAISDAYNIAGSSKVQICHIDYMDTVGADDRLDECFVALDETSNPDLKDVLTDVYTYQQELMQDCVTTFDAYAFLWSGSDINAWNTIQRILACFLQANYRSFQILNKDSLRDLSKVLNNLEEFSVIKAMSNAFNTETVSGVNAISIVRNGVETKLGKTFEEMKMERDLAEKEEMLKKQEIKARKHQKSVDMYDDDEEIEL